MGKLLLGFTHLKSGTVCIRYPMSVLQIRASFSTRPVMLAVLIEYQDGKITNIEAADQCLNRTALIHQWRMVYGRSPPKHLSL